MTRKILSIGHRGAAGHAPENTIAAIRKGIALKADFVEVDVQRTRDGRLVLMHDKFVERTTNGSGRVTELTWDELRTLDAGEGERIPLLEDALAAVNGRIGIILETITPGIGADLYLATPAREADFTGDLRILSARRDPCHPQSCPRC